METNSLMLCFEHSFSYLKKVKIHFHVVPQFGLQNTFNFGQKLPLRTAHHTFLESKQPEVTKNPYYVRLLRGAKNGIS